MWFLFGVLHAEMWVWLLFTPAYIYNVNIPLIIKQQGCSHAPSMNTAGASLFSNHKVKWRAVSLTEVQMHIFILQIYRVFFVIYKITNVIRCLVGEFITVCSKVRLGTT